MDRNILSEIELFAFNTRPSFCRQPLAPGHWYLVLRLRSGGSDRYGEYQVLPQGGEFDVIRWGSYLRSFLYLTREEAAERLNIHEVKWITGQRELLLSALTAPAVSPSLELKLAAGLSDTAHRNGQSYRMKWHPLLPYAADLIKESTAYFSPV